MKVVAFNGSPRKNGNTSIMIETIFEELRKEGIATELVQLGGNPVRGCSACYLCRKNQNRRCAIDSDIINGCLAKMFESDGVILASPTYVSDVTSEMKALIDRACVVARSNGNPMRRKAGAAISAVRRAGAIHAIDSMNHFFSITEMVTVGSNYWNLAVGRDVGEVKSDDEGIETMKILGQNMAWLLKKIGA